MGKTSGTREWSYKNLNICKGCSNNCIYCYAYRMAYRFGRVKNREEWKDMKVIEAKVNKGYRKLNNPTNLFDYMFPTSHDITTENIDVCIIVLMKVLGAGNTVLITTKPNYDCIVELCKELEVFKDQILFRFTITSFDDDILKKYEPNAPSYKSRYMSVWEALNRGYKTSLSIEPFLDKDPLYLITRFFGESYPERLEIEYDGGYEGGYDIITDGIWLGLMSGTVPKELKSNYTKENILKIIENIKKLPEKVRKQIKLKDSIRNLLEQTKNARLDSFI